MTVLLVFAVSLLRMSLAKTPTSGHPHYLTHTNDRSCGTFFIHHLYAPPPKIRDPHGSTHIAPPSSADPPESPHTRQSRSRRPRTIRQHRKGKSFSTRKAHVRSRAPSAGYQIFHC